MTSDPYRSPGERPLGPRSRWLVIGAFLVGSSGCRSPVFLDCEGRFGLDPSFSDDDVVTIKAALARYTSWSGDRVEVTGFGTDGACGIVKLPPRSRSRHDDWDGNINLDFTAFEDEPGRQAVVLHETGHSFGLQHLPAGATGVMAGIAADIRVDFTVYDLDECHRAGHCQNRSGLE